MKLKSKLALPLLSLAFTAGAAQGAVMGQLGVLDISGTNPATGSQWAPGDTYRLIFVTSTTTTATSTDINTYNTFVQGVANGAGLGGITWSAVGSTSSVDARDNTGTNPGGGVGEAIILMDGASIVADNYADMWDSDGIAATLWTSSNTVGSDPTVDHARSIYLDESGNVQSPHGSADDRIFTGTLVDGTAHVTQPLGATNVSVGAVGGNFPAQFWGIQPSGDSPRWMVEFNSPSTQQQQMYGISETLTVVPEPSTTALLGLGGLALILRRRK
ncbi:MAG: PEP-CTERM sorting domain-containing protein [Akkermansiaceae bacterium]